MNEIEIVIWKYLDCLGNRKSVQSRNRRVEAGWKRTDGRRIWRKPPLHRNQCRCVAGSNRYSIRLHKRNLTDLFALPAAGPSPCAPYRYRYWSRCIPHFPTVQEKAKHIYFKYVSPDGLNWYYSAYATVDCRIRCFDAALHRQVDGRTARRKCISDTGRNVIVIMLIIFCFHLFSIEN